VRTLPCSISTSFLVLINKRIHTLHNQQKYFYYFISYLPFSKIIQPSTGIWQCFTCLHCHHIRYTRNHQCRLLVCHIRELVVQAVMTQKVCKVIKHNLLLMVSVSNVEYVHYQSFGNADPKKYCDNSKITILYHPVLLMPKQKLMYISVLLNVFKCKKYSLMVLDLGTHLLIVFPF